MMLLTALTLAGLALAAAPGNDPEFSTAFREDAREVRLIGSRYGDCVVKKDARSADAFIASYASEQNGAQRERLVARINDPQCLIDSSRGFGSVQMRFPADNMRYVLADALVRAHLAGASVPADLATRPRLAHPLFDETAYQPKPGKRLSAERTAELAAKRDAEMARIYLSRFGECVVRTDPANASALLSTKVVTPQENAAFGRLQPAFGQCISEGAKIALNKAVVRGTIALNYYRLARQQGTAMAAQAGQK